MILELFALKNYKTLERFIDSSGNTAITTDMIVYIVIILIASLIYTAGAISLSWNYNNYIGTSSGMKIFYAILVFIAPSIYYPVYGLVLSPIKSLRVTNTKRV
jgi:hypothetical protein